MTNTTSSIKQYSCPGCGASLEFHPKSGKLKCPYCGKEEAIAQSTEQVLERSFDEHFNLNKTHIAALSTTALEVSCPGCKAQLTFEPPDVAGKCPFCASNIVAQPKLADPTLAPEGLLPFTVDAKSAKRNIQTWIGNRWFAPNRLKTLAQQEKIQGVYLPFWTYDSQTVSQYRGQRGDYYYTTETYTETDSNGQQVTNTRQVRHTRWRSASGKVSRFFDDVLIPATQSIDRNRLNDLWSSFSASELHSYEPSYLAGFKAQRYQIDLKSGFELAKDVMARTIHIDVCKDIGGDEQRVAHVDTDHKQVTFKHILLPLWISSYRFNHKQYQVMVNARSGQVIGDRPYSIWKISLAVAAGVALIAGIYFGVRSVHDQQYPPPDSGISSPELLVP